MIPTIDLGKLRQTFKGVYDPAVQYEFNDVVLFGANSFVFTYAIAQIGKIPTDATRWQPMNTGVRYVGVWATGTTYLANDMVSSGNGFFLCLTGHVGGATLLADTVKWVKLVGGLNNAGAWTTLTNYVSGDLVVSGNGVYLCLTNHAAGATLAADAAKWQKLVGGQTWRGTWATATAYVVGDMFTDGQSVYIALTNHTSGATLAADITAAKVQLVAAGANLPASAGQDGKVLGVVGGVYALVDGKSKVVVLTAAANLVDGYSYSLDSATPAAAFNVTLPAAPAVGARICLDDGGNNLQSFPVTVLRNGSNINGVGDDLFVNSNGIALTLTYINATTGWRIS